VTLREIWLTLIGHPERAAETAETSVAKAFDDARLEPLDWTTTDSPSELIERAERAGKAASGGKPASSIG